MISFPPLTMMRSEGKRRESKKLRYTYMKREDEISSYEYDGLLIKYIGAFPSKRLVFFSSGKNMGKEGICTMYQSALECFKNGWNIAYVPGSRASEILEKAVYDTDKGSLFAFIPRGINTVSSSLLSRCIITGGGVLSVIEDDAVFSFEALMAAKSTAAMLSDATLCFSENDVYLPYHIQSSLDNGRFVAVSKSALKSRAYRRLTQEGAEVFHTFSDILYNARFCTHPDDKGKYAIMGERYNILDMEGYEKPRIHR